MTIALCAWLKREGVNVAPFKAQNMSNNAWATLEGDEMARAQAVQAEACGLRPIAAMNPILLKPTGAKGSQLILNGKAQGHFEALEYYKDFNRLWEIVREVLDGWKTQCDVLVMEGAGSPVELNLMDRDLVNLRPVRHLNGRWLLVGDIDRGGIYAQLAGTWNLMPEEDRTLGLGAIVNRFRGDLSLFPNPEEWLAPHAPGFPVLGTVPFRHDLQPEEEDGLVASDEDRGVGETIAWIRLPHAANLTDCQPWWDDAGVRTRWVSNPNKLNDARAIIIPGTKNTIGDLRWLKSNGLAAAITAAAKRGVLVIGLCGGYQILGEHLVDANGVAGDSGEETGLGLLPLNTVFKLPKTVRQVSASCGERTWTAYEIHVGQSEAAREVDRLHVVCENGVEHNEGMRLKNVWGTYLHGWMEAPEVRSLIAHTAGIANHQPHQQSWHERRQEIYTAMADHIEEHLNLGPVRKYLGI